MKIKIYILLLTLVTALPALAQIDISGTVKTKQGEALIGSNILIRGTSTGTVTDIDGAFKMSVPASMVDSSLFVSSIGYVTQVIPIGGRTTFNIVMVEDTEVLEEVVVTGYQSQIKGNITGSVGIVTSEMLTRLPVPGVDQLLQGRVPGVVVTQNTGAPGAGVRVRIRGIGSINSSNDPLYVIDGIPTLDATSINASDVASLSILKDASEAAIYGSRAANGVVIITTKLGQSNKPVISYNAQYGVQAPTRLIPMANTSEYVSLFNEAKTNDSAPGNTKITDDPATLPNVNWLKAITAKNPIVQTHTLTFSGGEGKTRYLLGGSYFSQDGIIKASDYKRGTIRVNVESQVKEWLRAGINLNLSSSTTDMIGASGDGAGGNGGSVVRYAYFRPSALPIYTSTGDFVDKPGDYYTSNPGKYLNFFGDGYNPVGMLAYNNNRLVTERAFGKIFFILNPIKGLTITSNTAVDYSTSTQRRFDRNWGDESTPGHLRINDPNTLTVTALRNQYLTFTNFAEYSRSFGLHNAKILVGTEAIKNTYYTQQNSDQKFPDQQTALVYLGNGLGVKTQYEHQEGSALLSFYGKLNYDWDRKYVASATVRRDGSSRFGVNNQWGTFYAGSLGWSLDREFFENSSWINRLFLRAGFGVNGNQEIPNYPNQNLLSNKFNYPFGDATASSGFNVTSFGNQSIRWEKSQQINIGVDWEILEGKISMSLDLFNKTTSNLLTKRILPASLGTLAQNGSPYTNNGTVVNKGVELGLSYKNTIGKFRFAISPNIAYLHNEVTKLAVYQADGIIGGTSVTRTDVGHPVGSFYMLQADGIFQSDAEVFTSAKPSKTNPKPGDVKYKDLDGDGIIDLDKDRKYAGSAIPKFTGGMNISLGYGAWDLVAFFQGSYGQKVYSVLNRDIEGFYRPFNVTQRYVDQHWTAENPSNKFPRASFAGGTNNTLFSTRFLEDGSYTRLKNLQIGYTVPKEFLDRYHLSSLRIYLSGTNLLTFTKYSGMDPEMTASDNANGSGDRSNGMDWGTYPAAKSYNIGLNLTF